MLLSYPVSVSVCANLPEKKVPHSCFLLSACLQWGYSVTRDCSRYCRLFQILQTMKTGGNYDREVGGVSKSKPELEKDVVTDVVSAPGPPTVVIMPTIRHKTGR